MIGPEDTASPVGVGWDILMVRLFIVLLIGFLVLGGLYISQHPEIDLSSGGPAVYGNITSWLGIR